jgi:hypothetical protein
LNDAKCELEDVVSKAEIEPEPVIINEDKKEEPESVVEFEEEKEPEPVVELEEEKKEEVVPESPEPEPTSKDYTISKNCTFILQSGTRKGQPCGKPAKVDGLCGIHQKKNIPVQGELDPSKCDCMILSGARKGQACGRPIKENGLCAIHLKSCPTRVSNIIEVSQQQSQIQPDKCPCLIQSGKNRNQVCGRSLQPGATTCKFHKEICTKSAITAPVEIVETIEPEEVKEAEPEEVKEAEPEEVKEAEPEEVKEAEPESFESIDEAELEAQM